MAVVMVLVDNFGKSRISTCKMWLRPQQVWPTIERGTPAVQTSMQQTWQHELMQFPDGLYDRVVTFYALYSSVTTPFSGSGNYKGMVYWRVNSSSSSLCLHGRMIVRNSAEIGLMSLWFGISWGLSTWTRVPHREDNSIGGTLKLMRVLQRSPGSQSQYTIH